MAFFRTVLQIFSMNTLKTSGGYLERLNKRPNISEISRICRRSLWTRKKQAPNPECCKKEIVNPLISKGERSQCIKVEPVKEVVVVKEKLPPCPKETFWTYIFGGVVKKDTRDFSDADPCTCRLSHKFKESIKEEDPRLCDPRYTATAGDVLLFTENPPPPLSIAPLEPQPKPPPNYKIPSGVTCKRIADAVAAHHCVHFCLPSTSDICKDDTHLEPEAFRIPYSEFRPAERPFSCGDGKRVENVYKPISKEVSPAFSSYCPEVPCPKLKKKNQLSDKETDSCKRGEKLSRIERLKKLTSGKQGIYRPLR